MFVMPRHTCPSFVASDHRVVSIHVALSLRPFKLPVPDSIKQADWAKILSNRIL